MYFLKYKYTLWRDIMKTATVSAKLDPEIATKLELLVKATARSKSYLVAEAIETYVKDQAWQIEAIEEGLREADKGKFATESQVRKTFKKWGVNGG
jgi:predicted transcriptional regulator